MKLRILNELYAEFDDFELPVVDEDPVIPAAGVTEDAEGVRRMETGFPDRGDSPMQEGGVFSRTALLWWMA